jgi:cyanophycinase-like exopeptidase
LLAGTPVWEAIVAAWRGGGALAGSSAGAMGLTEWGLFPRGRGGMARGLGLVPNCAVLPHFSTFGRGWAGRAQRAAPGVVLIGLEERTAAVWRDGGWFALGDGEVTVIVDGDRRTFEPGARIEGILAPT